jgi:hypothetical protein
VLICSFFFFFVIFLYVNNKWEEVNMRRSGFPWKFCLKYEGAIVLQQACGVVLHFHSHYEGRISESETRSKQLSAYYSSRAHSFNWIKSIELEYISNMTKYPVFGLNLFLWTSWHWSSYSQEALAPTNSETKVSTFVYRTSCGSQLS